jgi:hypothetical protein
VIWSDLVQIGTLTLRKLRDLEKESGMTGSKEGGSARRAEPTEEVRAQLRMLLKLSASTYSWFPCFIPVNNAE